MKAIAVEQNSLEWLQARAGVVTASELDAVITPEFKARKGEGVTTYLAQKVAERWIGGSLPGFQSIDMELGKILEDDAIPAYEFEYNEKITRVGLLTTDCGRIGCSPDGLIGEDGGIEIKCPRADTHVRNLITGQIPKEYIIQIHTGLYVTGRKWWKFMSYHRRFPSLVVTVERDEALIERMREAIMPFLERLDAAMLHLTQLNGGPPKRHVHPYQPEAYPQPARKQYVLHDEVVP